MIARILSDYALALATLAACGAWGACCFCCLRSINRR